MHDPQTIEAAVLAVLREADGPVNQWDIRGYWLSGDRFVADMLTLNMEPMKRALRRLKRRGLIRYTRTKAEGGPGWVLCEGVES